MNTLMLLHNEKVRCTTEHQDRFNNQRLINIIHINRIKDKQYGYLK